jgi:hypothetical protein
LEFGFEVSIADSETLVELSQCIFQVILLIELHSFIIGKSTLRGDWFFGDISNRSIESPALRERQILTLLSLMKILVRMNGGMSEGLIQRLWALWKSVLEYIGVGCVHWDFIWIQRREEPQWTEVSHWVRPLGNLEVIQILGRVELGGLFIEHSTVVNLMTSLSEVLCEL